MTSISRCDPTCPAPRSTPSCATRSPATGSSTRCTCIVADSRTVDPPPEPLELLFVDGDHSYEGARADYQRWGAFVRPGGHLLFHDAVDSGGYGNHYPGVARAVGEVDAGAWERQPDAGSIAHFVRR